jgi:precorrin-2/cobalt-factor-2 C20-methyltransferase
MLLTVIGVGPGDPELITLKGIRAIENADLVFLPSTGEGSESMALRAAFPWVDHNRQQVVHLPLVMTRDADKASSFYTAAAKLIARTFASRAITIGRDDVRGTYLLLGDPLLYGTFTAIGRELLACAPHIEIEVVPGVTSFAAAAARKQMVLGVGNERVAIVPATEDLNATSLRHLLTICNTLVLMKVGRVLPQILDALDELGLLGNALFAERVGMPDEDLVQDVRLLRGQQRSYLSLLIVRGEQTNGR